VQLPSTSTPSTLRIPGQWPTSPDGHIGAPTATIDHTFLTTVSSWAGVVSANLLSIPTFLVQRFFRKEKVVVQPIVREDGARKKRIIDASPLQDPDTPTPAPRTRADIVRHGQGRGQGRLSFMPSSPTQSYQALESIPDIWSPCPSPIKSASPALRQQIAHDACEDIQESFSDFDEDVGLDESSSEFDEDVGMDESSSNFDEVVDMGESEVEDHDDSLEFSFTNCLTNTPTVSPVRQQASRNPEDLSPNTHYNIIRKASVTPMRKSLLKRQVVAQGAIPKPSSPQANHTEPVTSVRLQEPTELQQKEYQASFLKKNAAVVAQEAQQSSERYKAQAEARQNSTTEVPAEDLLRFNYVETIDQDLSFLSDAPDYDEAAQILYSPSPSPRKKRSVRWSSHANAKPFYCDEVIADMMDSTLETINFSPVKPSVSDEIPEDDTSDDDSKSSDQDVVASNESVGFTGVPDSTWDDSDDSLEESQISLELLADLQQDMQNKLALAPPPPPPAPPVKALVTPLSSEEQDKLDATIKKTDNGKISDMFVVEEKLYARDFATLLPSQFNGDPRAWLNDNIVNEYLAILTADMKKKAGFVHKKGGAAPPVHAFSSFWYPTMKSRAQGVARWAARFQLAGKQYLDADLIFYPICDAGHWRLLVVKPQERTIEYLDSLGWSGTKYVDKLKEYLATELDDLWNEDEWTVLEKQRSTRQVNGSDCGVFTVLNALALMRGEEYTKVLACDGMPDARERIATTLMAGVPTTELD
jgi:hypothetical protein